SFFPTGKVGGKLGTVHVSIYTAVRCSVNVPWLEGPLLRPWCSRDISRASACLSTACVNRPQAHLPQATIRRQFSTKLRSMSNHAEQPALLAGRPETVTSRKA